MIILYLLAFFILAFLLIKSADFVLDSVKGISKTTGTKPFILSAIILSIATSLPELFVGIASAIEGESNLSLGNIIGANITNLTLVVGLSAMFAGVISVQGKAITREMVLATIAGILPFLLSIDGRLSRTDGLILLAIYISFVTSFFKLRFVEIGSHFFEHNFILRVVKHLGSLDKKSDKSLGNLFVGVAALLFASQLIVNLAGKISTYFDLPVFMIGLILLSLGTTLPELAVSYRAMKNNEPSIFFGNLMGSIIVNSTLIIGTVSLISPISSVNLPSEVVSAFTFVLSFVLFWLFVKSKLTLERWEAIILLIVYIIFVTVQFLV